MMRYRAILFDLDGTLIDSAPSILGCFGRVLEQTAITPLLPLTDSLIGPPLRQTLINLTGSDDPVLLDRLVNDFKNCYDTQGYKATQIYNGVETMLEALSKSGIHSAIATNKRRIPTLKIIDHLGWNKYFRMIATLDTPTPPFADKAAMIRFLLNEMQLDAENTLYVGDKREDGEAAAANNMPFCAAGWGYGEWDAFDIMPGLWIIERPERIIERL